MSSMEVVLYSRPSPSSKHEKLAGVQEIAEKANVHIQVIDEKPSKDRISRLMSF